jgi:hypothetical protein
MWCQPTNMGLGSLCNSFEKPPIQAWPLFLFGYFLRDLAMFLSYSELSFVFSDLEPKN